MRLDVTAAMAALVAACTGCGTVQNFTTGYDGRTKPYGGVDIAVEGIKYSHDVELTYTWPFRMADVGLSAVGDTLTLPVTLPVAAVHAVNDSIRDHYFPTEKTGGEWKRFWCNDTLPEKGGDSAAGNTAPQ